MDRHDAGQTPASERAQPASLVTAVPAMPNLQLAAAMGNAAFSRAVRGGFPVAGGRGAVAPSLARALAPAVPRSPWGASPVPGSDARLAARLEGLLSLPGGSLPRATVARAPGGRCACGGVAGPDGECEECKRKRLGQPAAGATVARQIQPDDPRLEDPGFLICTAFCYLGIPPSLFKDIVAAMLESAYQHFMAENPQDYRQRFRVYHTELGAYSKIRLLAKAFRFLMTGEIGLGITIRAAAATAVRERILARLAAAGCRLAALEAAEQVVRKVVFYIDMAIAAGCGTYCAADQMTRALLEVTDAASAALVQTLQILEGIGNAVRGAISDALASAYGQLDSVNWQLTSQLSDQTARNDLMALGLSLFAQVRPGGAFRRRTPDQSEADAFLANATRPISSFTTAYVQQNLLPSIAGALHRAGAGGSLGAEVTGARLAAMSPVGLVTLLRDEGFITFRQDPIAYANAAMAETQEPEPAAAP
jgi:hypothetical protein